MLPDGGEQTTVIAPAGAGYFTGSSVVAHRSVGADEDEDGELGPRVPSYHLREHVDDEGGGPPSHAEDDHDGGCAFRIRRSILRSLGGTW